MIRSLPASGELPEADPAVDTCSDCGDFIAWCPIWARRWPQLERYRDG